MDYGVASGIFNVRLKRSNLEWQAYVIDELRELDRLSTHGFAFNALSTYSDPSFRKDTLYYADPGFWFDFCKINFSRFVTLVHDYPLFEFTLVVRKTNAF